MIVTRAVSEGSLNEDVSAQFLAQPKAIMMTGAVMIVLMLVPGMPKIQLAIMAVALVASGLHLERKVKQSAAREEMLEAAHAVEEASQAPSDEESYYRDVNNVYSLINVEPIEMEFGYSLIPLIDESSGGKMINRIVIFRRQYAQDMGFVIPSVRLRDSSSLNTNQYVIKIRGEEVTKGEILVDYYLALEPPTLSGEVDGIETVEPAYGIPSKWIRPENKEMAEIYGYTVIDPLSVMLTHLSETIKQHAYEMLGRQEVMQLLENVKKHSAELVDELIPSQFTYGNLQKILNNLLKEGVPIKDMETILETIVDSIPVTRDIDVITENIRIALKRTITRMFCDGGQMKVLTLDADLEKNIISSMAKGEQGVYLALSPDVMQSVIGQMGEHIKKFSDLNQKPVVLTSQVVRLYFYRLIEQFYPNVYVLSFNEIANNIQIQAVGNITV
jgi:flagellar biosynthesis protein FlhA